ncbi:hypothetical protein WMY93_012937 [Mugilogobius chulae]|uniref:Uncharacterized protein n=1 Tax=Mugilogobius chulae TaxID=88201 RepID=A0AAW0NYJ7_9GOBI
MSSENPRQPRAQKGQEKPKRAPNPKVAVAIKGKIHRLMQGPVTMTTSSLTLPQRTGALSMESLIQAQRLVLQQAHQHTAGLCGRSGAQQRGLHQNPLHSARQKLSRTNQSEPRTQRQKRPHSAGNTLDYSQEESTALIENILKELRGINKIQEELWDLRLHLTSVRGSVEEVSSCVDAMLLEIEGMRSDSRARSTVAKRTKIRSRDALHVLAGGRTRREGFSSLELQDPQDYPSPSSLSSRYSSKSESDLEAETCWDFSQDSWMWPQHSHSVQAVNIRQSYSTREHEYYGYEEVCDCCGGSPASTRSTGKQDYATEPEHSTQGYSSNYYSSRKKNTSRQRTPSKEGLKGLKLQSCNRPGYSSEEGQEFYRHTRDSTRVALTYAPDIRRVTMALMF